MTTSGLVGRDHELGLLAEMASLVSTGRGAVAVLVGEAGIGKTALARALLEQVRELSWTVLYVAFDERETSVLPTIWEALPAAEPLHDPEESGGIGSMLVHPAERGAGRRLRLVTALDDLAGEGPLLLVLDDAHVADLDGLDVVLRLARLADGRQWLLILTVRLPSAGQVDDDATATMLAEVSRLPWCRRFDLRGLARDQLATLTATRTGTLPADSVIDAMFLETAGNPFYASELLRELDLQRKPDAPMPLPGAVRDVVQRRVQRLEPFVRRVLQAAAVIGSSFGLDVLIPLTRSNSAEVVDAIDGLLRHGFCRAEGAQRFAFTHDIVRRAVYESLAGGERLEVHRRLAELLSGRQAPAGLLAMHWVGAGRPDLATPLFAAAAAESGAHGEFERAAAYLRRGIEAASGDPVARLELRGRLAVVLSQALAVDELASILDAIEGDVAGGLVPHRWWQGLLAEVCAWLDEGGAPRGSWFHWARRAMMEPGVEPAAVAPLLLLAPTMERLPAGPWQIAYRHRPAEPAVAWSRASDSEWDQALAVSPFDHRSRRETDELERRVATWRGPRARLRVLDAVVRDHLHRHCDYRRALAAAETMLAVATDGGSISGQAEAWYEIAKCRAILGNLPGARMASAMVPDLVELLGSQHRLRLTARTALDLEIGYFGGMEWAAMADAAETAATDPATAETPMGLITLAFAALGRAMAGDGERARELCAELADVLVLVPPWAYQHKQAVDLLATAVWHTEADELATQVLDMEESADIRYGAAPITCTDLSAARMLSLVGRAADADDRFAAAHTWFQIRGCRPGAAVTLYERSLNQRRHDDEEATRPVIASARRQFRVLEMEWWSRKADGDTTPILPLTRREREILRLVATGSTNDEIATALFIAKATVKRHLANIYPKIGVRNRAGAAAYAHQQHLVD